MANSVQSNPVYYSLASLTSSENSSVRTVVLHQRSDHGGFGVYIGEDIPSGLYVVTVERNSPAADANIQPGDRVLAFNGQSVASIQNNPKEKLIQAATNAQTLALTIKSTDLFQTLDMPLINTSNFNQNIKSQNVRHFAARHTVPSGTDLESYIRSLFVDENVQILQAGTQENSKPTSHSLRLLADDRNTLPTQQKGEKTRRPHRHHHHHHRQRPVLVTVETQTSIDNDENGDKFDERQVQSSSTRSYPTRPNMGLNQVALKNQFSNSADNLKKELKPVENQKPSEFSRISTSSSSDKERLSEKQPNRNSLPATTATVLASSVYPKSDNTTTTNLNMTHMADVVTAAVQANRNNQQNDDRSRPSTGGQPQTARQAAEPVYTSATGSSTARTPQQPTGRDQPPRSPPPYTEKRNSAPAENNRDSTEGTSYNVRTGQINQPTSSPVRGDNVRELHLTRQPDFQGFGFHLQYNKAYYLVQSVEPNSPAVKADLRPHEVILSINGERTTNMTHATFVQIVNSSATVDFVVQPLNDYLRVNPSPSRNQAAVAPTATTPASSSANQEKPKRGLSKALEKIANH